MKNGTAERFFPLTSVVDFSAVRLRATFEHEFELTTTYESGVMYK